jgi:hypothetical protein
MKGKRTVARGVLVVLSVGAQACGGERGTKRRPSDPIDPVDLGGETTKSGERLRSVTWLSDEGLEVPALRFLDTERDEECAFGRATDGDFRCFPDAVTDFPFGYVDADCHTPVFLACKPYASLSDIPGCTNTGARLFDLGDVIVGAPRIASNCAFSLKTARGDEYRRMGARLRDGEFVRAVAGTAERGGRIGTRQLSAEDGSGLMLGFYDADERAPCEPFSFMPDDPKRCVPAPFAPIDTYFEDEECSGDGVRLAFNYCETPLIGRPLNERRLYRLGARARLPPYLSDVLGCSPAAASQGYEVLEPVELDTFASIELAHVGEGRVRMNVAASADGSTVVPDPVRGRFRLWDEELGLQCSIARSSDGEYRCLPTLYGPYHTNLFADDQCETPVVAHSGGMPRPDEPAWFLWTVVTTERGCAADSKTFVYELAEQPFAGQMYIPSSDIDGNPLCIEYTGTRDDPVFTLGNEVASDRFVRFERRVE